MDGIITAIVLDLAMVRGAFPAWRIAGSPGCWYAVRDGRVGYVGPSSLLRCYLSGPDLPQLVEKLGLQEYLDHLSPEELADVWKRVVPPLPDDPS